MKMIVKYILFIVLLSILAFANVFLQAPKSFLKGEPVYFSIQAMGENIEFPKIEKIDSFLVEASGTSRSISNINGKITSKLTKRYRFFPTKKVTIPVFSVLINGKEYQTKQQVIDKQNISQTKSVYFELNLEASQEKLYVGESTQLTLQFKHRKDVQLVDLDLTLPTFENFWSKQLNQAKKYEEGDFIVQELDFLIFPQKSGQLKIEPIKIDVATLDVNSNSYSFFNRSTKNIRVFSNEIVFTVNPLPQNVSLIGEFELLTTVDKMKVNEGEAISFKVEIDGYGNIDDVEDITLNINNSVIYENKPEIKTSIENGQYKGSYTKSFSILPSNDLTIPSIQIEYFNKKSQKVEILSSKSYTIKVNKKIKETPVKLEKKQESKVNEKLVARETSVIQVKSSWQDRTLFYFLGMLTVLLMIGLYYYVINRNNKKRNEDLPLIKCVKRTKNKEELLKVLLPYINSDASLDELIFELEKTQKETFKSIKKSILELLKTRKIKEI